MIVKKQLLMIIRISFLVIGIALLLFPILWTATTSLKTPPEITIIPPTFLPDNLWNFSNYVEVFKRLHFIQLYKNSILLCISVLSVSLIITPLTGYGFAKFSFLGKEFLYFTIIGVLMVPFQSVAVPLFKWFNYFHMVNTFVGLSLPLLISAFGVVLMREFISTIPNAYIEAARIDGSSEIGIFVRIILPMIKPALATLAIIKFMWTWNEFFWPLLIITEPIKAVVTVGLSYLSNMYFKEYHLVTAAATLSLLPLFFLFVILRHWMVKALAGSGIKV